MYSYFSLLNEDLIFTFGPIIFGTCIIIASLVISFGLQKVVRTLTVTSFSRKVQPDNFPPLESRAPESKQRLKSQGLKELAPGTSPIVDIVAIHGLDGHSYESWTAENGICWLKDLLPNEIPDARVLTYGYDADTRGEKQLSNQTLFDLAEELLGRVARFRIDSDTQDRQIIFIAHSLGGIVLKWALNIGNQKNERDLPHFKAVENATYGILFLGTPHQGSAIVDLALAIAQLRFYTKTNTTVLKHLRSQSEMLQSQLSMFTSISDKYITKFFFEVYATPLAGNISNQLVPKASAVIPQINAEAIPIHKNHVEMSKFLSNDDEDFQTVLSHLRDMVKGIRLKYPENQSRSLSHEGIGMNDNLSRERAPLPRLPYHMGGKTIVGRASMLELIHDTFFKSELSLVALYGIGGLGKTRIAVEYIYFHRHVYDMIFWVNADTVKSTKAAFMTMAQQVIEWKSRDPMSRTRRKSADVCFELGLENCVNLEQGQAMHNAEKVIGDIIGYLSKQESGNWLLVFDNADDLDSVYLPEFFPSSIQGRIIITSRTKECKNIADQYNGRAYSVSKLSKEHALELLVRKAGKNEDEAAKKIVEKLECLPLAIETAGAYISQLELSYKTYLERHEQYWSKIFTSSLLGYSNKKSLVAAWEVSFEVIQKRYPASAELLTVCAFLGHSNIPEHIFTGQGDDILERLKPLLLFSLAERTSEEKYFSLHPLVHEWARERLKDDEKKQEVANAVKLVSDALGPWNTCKLCKSEPEGLIPHIHACTKNALRYALTKPALGEDDPTALKALLQVGLAHMHFLVFEATIDENDEKSLVATSPLVLMENILKSQKKALGNRNQPVIQTLTAVHNISLEHLHGSEENEFIRLTFSDLLKLLIEHLVPNLRFDDAKDFFERSLKMSRSIFGDDNSLTTAIVHGFAYSLTDQERYEDAERLLLSFIDVDNRLKEDELGTTRLKVDLSKMYRFLRRFDDANQLFSNSLQVVEDRLGANHDFTLDVVDCRAHWLTDSGRVDEARALLESRLQAAKKDLGVDNEAVVKLTRTFAKVLMDEDVGRYAEAERLAREAAETWQRTKDEDDLDAFWYQLTLSQSIGRQRRHADEVVFLRKQLVLSNKTFGTEHWQTLAWTTLLSSALAQQYYLHDAEKLALDNFRVMETKMGEDDYRTLNTMDVLGSVMSKLNRLDESELWFRKLLHIQQKVLGHAHPHTFHALNGLGMLHTKQCRFQEGERLLRLALERAEKFYGPQGQATIAIVDSLGVALYEAHRHAFITEKLLVANGKGSTLKNQNQRSEGVQLLRRSLEERAVFNDPDQVATLTGHLNLGVALVDERQYSEAIDLLRIALERVNRLLGKDHPESLLASFDLSVALIAAHRISEAEEYICHVPEKQSLLMGWNHPFTLWATNCLATLRVHQHQVDDAESMIRSRLSQSDKAAFLETRMILASSIVLLIAVFVKDGWTERAISFVEACLGRSSPKSEHERLFSNALDRVQELLRKQHYEELSDLLEKLSNALQLQAHFTERA